MAPIKWFKTETHGKYYGFVAGFMVQKQNEYCWIGATEKPLIKFTEKSLYKFLTV